MADSNRQPVHSNGQLSMNVNLFKLAQAVKDSTNPKQQLAAIESVRELISLDNNPPITQILETGILPTLVDFLNEKYEAKLQYEALWILVNITSGTTEQTNKIIEAGAVPLLVKLMFSQVLQVSEHAACVLGNLCGDGPTLRDKVLQYELVQPLISLLKSDVPVSFLNRLSRIVLNLVRWTNPQLPAAALPEILPAINLLIQHEDTKILMKAIWAINYLAEGGEHQIKLLLDFDLVSQIVPFLRHTKSSVVEATLIAIEHFVSGSDEQTQKVLNYGTLSYFPDLLNHTVKRIRKRSVSILSNVTAGTTIQIQVVIDNGLLPKIIKYLSYKFCQKDAAYAISNLSACGNRDQIFALINDGLMEPYIELLGSQDTEIIFLVLDGLHNMLKKAGPEAGKLTTLIKKYKGLHKIASLQAHLNSKISKIAHTIITNWLEPQSNNEEFVFGFQSGKSPTEEFKF